MSRSHSFSVEIANEFGVNVALMLNHFSFWYLKNKADNVHFRKNDYWVRMKAATMKQYYPYYSERQLRHLVDKMIDLELLKQDEFNDKKNDRTKWYCLTKKSKKVLQISTDKNVSNIKKQVFKKPVISTDKNVTNVTHKIVSLTDKNVTSIEEDTKDIYYYYSEKIISNKSLLEIIAMQNRIKISTIKNKINEFVLHCKSVQKIHNNDGDIFNHFSSWIRKQNLKDQDLEIELNWFVKLFNDVSKCDYKISETITQRFAKQFEVGFSGDNFRTAIRNLYSSSPENSFHIKSKFKFATPEYLLKDDNMNKYLNFKI
jgi:hypothetical protein